MDMKDFGSAAIIGMALVVAGGVIVGFDASDADIARPPSMERRVSATALDSVTAKTQFVRDPLNRYAVYSLFQEATETPGEMEPARLLDLAAARSLRDGEIQSALIDRLIRSSAYSEAVYRLDSLMRARPSFRSGLSEVLVQFAQGPQSRQALIDVLAEDPPWRKAFLAYLAGSNQDLAIVSSVFIGLRSTRVPPRVPELRPLLDRMVLSGDATAAYSLWLSFLSEDQLARAGFVYDGEFEATRTEAPFDWTIKSAMNVKARTLTSAQASRGKVLEVTFANSQVSYGNVYQSLLIPPGRYVLAGNYKTSRLETERGLAWRLYCAGNMPQAIVQSPPMSGTGDWSGFEVRFAVPETGCQSQTLKLELIAKAYLDRKASGTLWADAITIRRDDQ